MTAALLPWYAQVFSVTLEWQSQVLKRHDGTEQRLARLASPRETYKVEYLLEDVDLREVRRLLMFAPAAGFCLPIRAEGVFATAAITGTTAQADTTLVDWPAVGVDVLVENQRGQYYQTTISSLSGYPGATTFTLAASPPGGETYAAGLSRIVPLVLVDIADKSPLQRYRVNAGRWSITARRRSFATVFGTGAALATYDGVPVLDRYPDGVDQVEEQVDAGLTVFDEGASSETETSRTNSDVVRFHRYQVGARPGSADRDFDAEWQWWRKFLYATRGCQKPFLLPTWRADVILHATPTPGSSTLVVEATPSYLSWHASTADRRLQITTDLAGGGWTWVKVASVVDNLDGTHTITLTGPDVPADPIESISFLETCRLEQNATTIAVDVSGAKVGVQARVVQDPGSESPSTYTQYEASSYSSLATELWKIVTTQTTYYLTPNELPYTFALDGQTYSVIPGARADLVAASTADAHDMMLTVPAARTGSPPAWHALVRDNAFGMPSQDIQLYIYRVLPGGAYLEIYRGKITSFSIEGKDCEIRAVNRLADALDGDVPAARIQRQCNRVLYDTTRTRCMVDRATYLQSTTVSSVGGTSVIVAAVGAHPNGWYDAGEIVRASDGERRLIKKQVGTTLTLDAAFRTLNPADAVSLYPGCDHSLSGSNGCRPKFNNAVNFGGHFYVPLQSPFGGSVVGKVWG